MSGLFGNLEMSKRALQMNQTNLATTSHNISNADTEGYSRQRVEQVTGTPLNKVYGQVGNGVSIKQIIRHHDQLLTDHYLLENAHFGEWEKQELLMNEVESIWNEPSEYGLNKTMTEFFNAWSDLANHPEMKSMKINVIEKAKDLVYTLHRMDKELAGIRERSESEIIDRVGKLNEYARQIAELNVGIASVEYNQNMHANDLRDRRELLINQMGTIAGVTVKEFDSGMVKVMISGMSLVENDQVYEVIADKRISSNDIDKVDIIFPIHQNQKATVQSGELKGLMDIRDDFIPEIMKGLDDLAVSLVKEINSLHNNGYGTEDQLNADVDFFRSFVTGARDIEVSYEVEQNPEKVAASRTGASGDNEIALEISLLKDKKLMDNNTLTYTRYYEVMTNKIGLKTQIAEKNRENQEKLRDQVSNFKENIIGVQLDAELSALIRYQGSYQAAARIVTTVDKLLDTVINRMAV